MEMIVVDSYIQWTECNGIRRGEIINEYEPLPSKYCVFTGHRKCSPKYAEDHIRALLTEVIRNHEPDVFMIGMGPGADLLAAKILSEWNIRWQAIIPFEGHYTKWSMRDKSLLDELLAYAEDPIKISKKVKYPFSALRGAPACGGVLLRAILFI